MKKILLTSTGFDNKNIMNKFIELLDVDVKDAKVLFIINFSVNKNKNKHKRLSHNYLFLTIKK